MNPEREGIRDERQTEVSDFFSIVSWNKTSKSSLDIVNTSKLFI